MHIYTLQMLTKKKRTWLSKFKLTMHIAFSVVRILFLLLLLLLLFLLLYKYSYFYSYFLNGSSAT